MAVKQQRIQIVVDAATKKRVKIVAAKEKRSAQLMAGLLLERALVLAEKELGIGK